MTAPLTTLRHYVNGAPAALLNTGINASAVTYALSTGTGWPAVPFPLILDFEGAAEEVVLVTAMSGATVTNCTRGYDGTSAQSHSVGAACVHGIIAKDPNESSVHNSSTGAHGTASPVVGATDAQTLTNKTISSSTHQATTTDLAIRALAAASGSASLLEGYNSTGSTLLAKIGRAGDTFINPTDPAKPSLVVKGAAAQSANIDEVQDSNGVKLFVVDPAGRIVHKTTSVVSPAYKYVPPSSTSGPFLSLRDTGDAVDQFLLQNTGEILSAAKIWLRGFFTDDPIRYPLNGSLFKVDQNGVVTAPNMGGRVARNTDVSTFSAAGGGATEGMGHSHAYPVVNGRRYRFKANFQTSAASGVTLRQMTARVSSGAVTNASTLIFLRQFPITGALRADLEYTGEFVASATGTWNIALGIMTAGGAGNTSVDASEVFLDDVGV